MAVFISRRLLRLTVLVGICLGVLLLISPRGSVDQIDSTQQYLSDIFSSGLEFDTGKLFGSKSDDEISGEQKLEEQRHDAEAATEKQHEDGLEGTLEYSEFETYDEESKALKESAEKASSNDEPAVQSSDKMLPATSSAWDFMKPSYAKKGTRPKACFVSLVRNEELSTILESIAQVEQKFNKVFQYPWVFLNDKEFTQEFKTKVTAAVNGEVEFELIPEEHWSYPSFVDLEKAASERNKMAVEGVIYGDSESYRHMCRFQSGFFWRQKVLDKYDWYWRVEPSIKIYCDIDYDVFQWMQDNEMAYGFTITIHEYMRTIESLWDTVRQWWKKNPQYIARNNLLDFISYDKGETYNSCHFWSNFEIANLNLWRSPAYTDYFNYLDNTGNFFYERWGDAPVHSIAASLILPKDKIHYFSDIGYNHLPYDNCPTDKNIFKEKKCECDPNNDFTFRGYACGVEYFDAQGLTKPDNWESLHN